jgi:hypothetical protein
MNLATCAIICIFIGVSGGDAPPYTPASCSPRPFFCGAVEEENRQPMTPSPQPSEAQRKAVCLLCNLTHAADDRYSFGSDHILVRGSAHYQG